jgi:Protein of unknown function (DUF3592)
MGKSVWLFGGIFGGIGAVMLVAAALILLSTLTFRREAVSASGEVVELDSGKPVVEFVGPDGAKHRVVGRVSSNPPAYEFGERVTVRYRPGQPGAARIDGLLESSFGPTLLGTLGTVFTVIGSAFLLSEIRKRRLRAWLHQFGVRVQAKYTGVRLDTSMRVNRRNPWRLTAQWQDPVTSLVHSFESDMLFWDPSDYVQRDTVEVWIDANDPSRHYLDTAFLPKHAGA